jgi:hypothetical protein
MSFFSSIFGRATSAISGGDATTKRGYLNTIFNDLVINTNEIDINKLTNPKICQDYVFMLQRSFKDLEEARKAKKTKTILMSSTEGDAFDLVLFFQKSRGRPSDTDICKEISVFYLQLIFLMYTVVLTTGTQYQPPGGFDIRRRTTTFGATRRRQYGGTQTRKVQQRGGDMPAEDFANFIFSRYPQPTDLFVQSENYRLLYPESIPNDVPKELVLYQRKRDQNHAYFLVYLKGSKTNFVQFYAEFSGYDSTSFNMTIYRNATPGRDVKNYPILKANARIRGERFTFDSDRRLMSIIWGINEENPHSFETLVSMLRTAAKVTLDIISCNRLSILEGTIDPSRKVCPFSGSTATAYGPPGTTDQPATLSTQFSTVATEIRSNMAVPQASLYQKRKGMVTYSGDRIQITDFKSDYLMKISNILCRGVSYFGPNSAIIPRLRPMLEDWDRLRKSNEQRFSGIIRTLPPLSREQKTELDKVSKKMDEMWNKYTVTVGNYITTNVMIFELGRFKINEDFFRPDRVRASSLKKMDQVVEKVGELMLLHFIELEQVVKDVIDRVLIYTGRPIYGSAPSTGGFFYRD